GFAPRSVRGSPRLVALLGGASAAVEAELGAAHITLEERAPTLAPTLIPPLRRDGDRLLFPAGRDVWLGLHDGRVGGPIRAEVTRDGGARAAEVGEDDAGNTLVRVPWEALDVGAHTVRIYAASRARALASVEIVIEPPAREVALARWRTAL